jgi:hypothetical protein
MDKEDEISGKAKHMSTLIWQSENSVYQQPLGETLNVNSLIIWVDIESLLCK